MSADLADSCVYGMNTALERNLVMPYFIERAEYEIAAAKKAVANPDLMNDWCDLSRQAAIKDSASTVEERAEYLYSYFKMRMSLTSPSGIVIDPAARRDWQAMLNGTYVQWWRRNGN